jgi:type IX secretion system PorP/SprF family membrane protein
MKAWRVKNSIALIFMVSCAFSQDIHFSQFYESPVLLNPASAGACVNDFRFTANYRNQWQNVISPFKTIGLAFDSKLHHLSENGFNHFGYGITIYTDKAGASRSATNQFNLAAVYHLYIDRKNIISFGVNGGMFQKSINTGGLKWDAQFNGKTYDPSLSSQESANYQSIMKFDMGAGLLYRHQENSSGVSYECGAAMNHLTKPGISYNSSDPSLQFKYSVTGNAKAKLSPVLYLVPATLVALQGGHQEIVAGGNLRYVSSDHGKEKDQLGTHKAISTAFQFGCFYRYKDAVVFTAGVEYDHHINLGISYDLNVSKLRSASRLRGGYEICITYSEHKHSKLRSRH